LNSFETAAVTTPHSARQERQRRNVRRTALVLSLIAAAFYIGFILMSVSRALR
jgi:hypothetical protein